jgi:hypothetical protein
MDTDWTGQPQPARDWEEIQLSIADHPDEMVLVTVVDLQTGQPVRDWTPTLNDVVDELLKPENIGQLMVNSPAPITVRTSRGDMDVSWRLVPVEG